MDGRKSGWSQKVTPEGETYYFNDNTLKTQSKRPHYTRYEHESLVEKCNSWLETPDKEIELLEKQEPMDVVIKRMADAHDAAREKYDAVHGKPTPKKRGRSSMTPEIVDAWQAEIQANGREFGIPIKK